MTDLGPPKAPPGHQSLDDLTWSQVLSLLEEYGVSEEDKTRILENMGCACCAGGWSLSIELGPPRTPGF